MKDVRVHNKPSVSAKSPTKATTIAAQDDCLFLGLGKDHAWRALSPAGLRDAAAKVLELPPQNIGHTYRIPTGFAHRAKNQEAKQLLVNSAASFVQVGAKLEKVSDLLCWLG